MSEPWIKPAEPKYFRENGIEYFWIYSWPVRWFIFKPVRMVQKILWFCGIAVHDPVFGICTPDFNCCVANLGRKVFIRFPEKDA